VDPSSSLAFNVRFPGQYFDAETGLHYNRFRYYDAARGRFMSPDPLGQTQGLNLYAYVENDPLYFVDPLGLGKLPGHHVVPVSVFENAGVSDAAYEVFDSAKTDWDPKLPPHNFSGGHKAYNDAVGKLFDEYLEETGKEASELSAKEANEFVEKVLRSKNPEIKKFLDAISKLLGRNCRAIARKAAQAASAVGGAGMAMDTITAKCMDDPVMCKAMFE
jgi:RHS repeat-associated protein